eukprot:gb/GFBE01014672.1/.p1 GENE.gb/GFBE01014672.1/~~gb/GFBE01014672.1/.p1  ORF type:complete len:299 (+),score=54.42 gb/GFBE01014672.1/:1-897(+)
MPSWMLAADVLRARWENALRAIAEDWCGLQRMWNLCKEDSSFLEAVAAYRALRRHDVAKRLQMDNNLIAGKLDTHLEVLKVAIDEVEHSSKFLLYEVLRVDKEVGPLDEWAGVRSATIESYGAGQRPEAMPEAMWQRLHTFSTELSRASSAAVQAALRSLKLAKTLVRRQQPSPALRSSAVELRKECERMLDTARHNHRELKRCDDVLNLDRRPLVQQVADLREKREREFRAAPAVACGCAKRPTSAPAACRPSSAPARSRSAKLDGFRQGSQTSPLHAAARRPGSTTASGRLRSWTR